MREQKRLKPMRGLDKRRKLAAIAVALGLLAFSPLPFSAPTPVTVHAEKLKPAEQQLDREQVRTLLHTPLVVLNAVRTLAEIY